MAPAAEIRIFQSPDELAREAADLFTWLGGQAIQQTGRFRVCLTGGSTPKACYEALASPAFAARLDWRAVEFYFGDERGVPPDDVHSNYRMARETLLDPLRISADRVLRMRGELPPDEAARQHAEVLQERFGTAWPRFPLLLLGLGEDGHVASLFPSTPALSESTRPVIATVSPKPPHPRITLTIPVLNRAEAVVFLVSGAAKAEAVRRTVEHAGPPDPRLPASYVRPAKGRLIWLMDRAAAAELSMAKQAIVSHEE